MQDNKKENVEFWDGLRQYLEHPDVQSWAPEELIKQLRCKCNGALHRHTVILLPPWQLLPQGQVDQWQKVANFLEVTRGWSPEMVVQQLRLKAQLPLLSKEAKKFLP